MVYLGLGFWDGEAYRKGSPAVRVGLFVGSGFGGAGSLCLLSMILLVVNAVV
jgi:hypothetical protein